MINFPRLSHIQIEDYGLYPGPEGKDGLNAKIPPGLTLVIGANGLGKTTLVTLFYRMLSGPADIPSLNAGEELGTRRLEAKEVNPTVRKMFAARVADNAINAKATLSLEFGDQNVQIVRRLNDLSIISLHIDDEAVEDVNEAEFQEKLKGLAGLSSFGDFLLMLRYLVFYFEDRRALVWDQSAQRQLLRMLFLPPTESELWTKMERSILSQDSDIRNTQAVVNRQERQFTKNVSKVQSASTLRTELKALENLQENDRPRYAELASFIPELDAERKAAISAHLQAQQEREAKFRAVEEAKLIAIKSRFPRQAETSRYILAHLMSESECLVCGSSAPDAAKEYFDRIATEQCVVCETPLAQVENVIEAHQVADERVRKRQEKFEAAEKMLTGTEKRRSSAELAYDENRKSIAKVEAAIAERTARIEEIASLLPPGEVELRKQRDDLNSFRSTLDAQKAQLAEDRHAFASFIAERTDDLLRQSGRIVELFDQYASGFLSEKVSLTWSTMKAKIGQTGEAIEFPSFDLDMSGSDFDTSVRRSGPSDVSESQREFIDLAFRMALMRASSANGSGSLVIDTPESSLDVVFAKHAAKILLVFSGEEGNSMLITSNLVEGSLIPTLAAGIAEEEYPREHLIDLFSIARSTAAVSDEQEAYDDARQRLLGPALS